MRKTTGTNASVLRRRVLGKERRTGMSFVRGKQIRDGGEGYIFEVQGRSDLLMKIYKDKNNSGNPIVTSELQNKLTYMMKNPPASLIQRGVIAWPLELVYEKEKLIGFVMPKLKFDMSILSAYAYKHPKIDRYYSDFPSAKSRIGMAINLSSALLEIHRAGYVVGDFNHENVGVNKSTGQVVFVDVDSFHVTDSFGNIFRTNVVMPGYLAPEIIRHCHSERAKKLPYEIDKVTGETFTEQSDLFCLAVHIFRLLNNGVSPFLGVLSNAKGSTASPFQGHEAVERNAYVFNLGMRASAVFSLSQDELPKVLMSMFQRAFVEGHTDRSKRPVAEDWYRALKEYWDLLVECQKNKKHHYGKELLKCPFCEADNRHWKVQSKGASLQNERQIVKQSTNKQKSFPVAKGNVVDCKTNKKHHYVNSLSKSPFCESKFKKTTQIKKISEPVIFNGGANTKGLREEKKMLNCSQCNTQLEGGVKYCFDCGNNVSVMERATLPMGIKEYQEDYCLPIPPLHQNEQIACLMEALLPSNEYRNSLLLLTDKRIICKGIKYILFRGFSYNPKLEWSIPYDEVTEISVFEIEPFTEDDFPYLGINIKRSRGKDFQFSLSLENKKAQHIADSIVHYLQQSVTV